MAWPLLPRTPVLPIIEPADDRQRDMYAAPITTATMANDAYQVAEPYVFGGETIVRAGP